MNTTTTETKASRPRKTLTVFEVIQSIEVAALPAPTGEAIRTNTTVEQCAKIRSLLKAVGIKGVSVKRSSSSWTATVSVSFASIPHLELQNWATHASHECDICIRNNKARDQIEAVILAAFPDCGNRSDLQSDYFDYVFSVRAE